MSFTNRKTPNWKSKIKIKIKTKIKTSPYLHSILFGLFPVLSLLANNITEIEIVDSFRSLLYSTLGVIFSLILFNFIFRDSYKVGLFITFAIFMFFSYGHVSNLLGNSTIFGIQLGSNRLLIPLYMVVSAIFTWGVLQNNIASESITKTLNYVAIILIAIPIFHISYIQINSLLPDKLNEIFKFQNITNQQHHTNNRYPDIYYILLDGYPRDDILLNEFNFDNSEFLFYLEERNFYIARCSQSNYSFTRPAMASTFNMTYLGDYEDQNHIAFDEAELNAMIEDSYVQKIIKDLDYTIITFDTGYKWLKWSNPDFYFSPFSNKDRGFKYTNLNDFEVLFINTTAGSIILDQINWEKYLTNGPRQIQYYRILYDFDILSQIPELIPELKFVYAHISAPHPPFIFGPNGEFRQNDPQSDLEGYIDQVKQINSLVINTIDNIISRSNESPIIIIQSDHGASIDYKNEKIDPINKLGILNAYRLPGIKSNLLYQSISPVNTFRLVINTYFSGDFEILEDLSILGNESPFQLLECNPKINN